MQRSGGSNPTVKKVETCWSGRSGWIYIELRDSEISGKVQRSEGRRGQEIPTTTVREVDTCWSGRSGWIYKTQGKCKGHRGKGRGEEVLTPLSEGI